MLAEDKLIADFKFRTGRGYVYGWCEVGVLDVNTGSVKCNFGGWYDSGSDWMA